MYWTSSLRRGRITEEPLLYSNYEKALSSIFSTGTCIGSVRLRGTDSENNLRLWIFRECPI